MPDSAYFDSAENVSASLGDGWEMLSGEPRVFEAVAAPVNSPDYAEFSYLLPLRMFSKKHPCGVGVLIQRDDALTLAANMFGVLPLDIPDEDLKDACSELCNVFSDSIAMHLSGNEDVGIGLPFMVDSQNYAKICNHSVVTEIYQSSINSTRILVVVLDPLLMPEPAKSAHGN